MSRRESIYGTTTTRPTTPRGQTRSLGSSIGVYQRQPEQRNHGAGCPGVTTTQTSPSGYTSMHVVDPKIQLLGRGQSRAPGWRVGHAATQQRDVCQADDLTVHRPIISERVFHSTKQLAMQSKTKILCRQQSHRYRRRQRKPTALRTAAPRLLVITDTSTVSTTTARASSGRPRYAEDTTGNLAANLAAAFSTQQHPAAQRQLHYNPGLLS